MKRVAAVDIGTNSVRLLVAEVDGSSPREAKVVPIDRRMRITRLGEGVDGNRALGPAAIERTAVVLREYRDALREHDVTDIRATATSAARDATNRDDFFAAAQDALGVTPELLSGDEEAALSFLGATADLDAPAPYLVVDIGGGSTEFVLGTDSPVGLVSLDIGCVRISEQFLHSDPPAPEELSNAVAVVRDLVAEVPRVIPARSTRSPSSAWRARSRPFAAIEQGLPDYDAEKLHHFRLTKAAAEDVFRTLATETAAQRAHNPGLEAGRVDVIVGGAAVLVGIFRVLGFDDMLVSEADILDGLVRSQVSHTREATAQETRSSRRIAAPEVVNPPTRHHFVPRMGVMTLTEFNAALRRLSVDDIHHIARSLASDTAGDEVDTWHTTIAIDRALRHSHRTRHAAQAAWDAAQCVQRVAEENGVDLPDIDVTHVARGSGDRPRVDRG